MVLVHVDHGILREPAAAERQKAGRIDFAGVADEHDALAVADAQRRTVAAAGRAVVRSPCGPASGSPPCSSTNRR